jgi:hypothetical protein
MAERQLIKVESDGKDTYYYYSNGDVVVFDEKNKSYAEKSTDAGVETWTYFDPAGNVEKTSEIDPNGTTTETKSDGTVTRTDPNGDVYTSNRDGSWKSYDKASDTLIDGNTSGVTRIEKDGEVVFSADAGTTTSDTQTDAGVSQTETDGGITISLPDGGTVSISRDGGVTITASDGGVVCRQSISDSWLGNLRECLAHLV